MVVVLTTIIIAAATLLVPFIAFYLNNSARITANQPHQIKQLAFSITPSARLLTACFMALIFSVPVGLITFCIGVAINILTVPLFVSPYLFDYFLLSLDSGLTAAFVFAVSFIAHAGFLEPLVWWKNDRTYPWVVTITSGALGYMAAFIGNTIWAFALGISVDHVGVPLDSIDAGVASAIVGWGAGLCCHLVSALRAASAPDLKS